MDPGELVEKHMRELQDALAVSVTSLTSEYVQRIETLQDELKNSKTLLDYFRKESRETQEGMEVMKNQLQALTESCRQDLRAEMSAEPRLVCLIDGDGCIFSCEQIARGRQGGQEIAHRLTAGVKQHFGLTRCQVHARVFCNLRGVRFALEKHGEPRAAAGLDAFVHGFNQANGRFLMVDVGPGKEVADNKIRDGLEDELKSVQTARVIFGGCHDQGYCTFIRPYITSGLSDNRLVLLRAHETMAQGFDSLKLPTMTIPGLFADKELSGSAVNPAPFAPPPHPTPSVNIGRTGPPTVFTPAATKGRASDMSAVQPPSPPTVASPSHDSRELPARRPRPIDPTKPITKQVPPPCNLFYITQTCMRGDSCTFGHDYELTAGHVAQMREMAKKSPCPTANRGEVCPHGASCIWGHRCAFATKCHFYQAGQCKFAGPDMHVAG